MNVANSPMWRWNATCGSLSWNGMLYFSIIRFQRPNADVAVGDVIVAQPHVERRTSAGTSSLTILPSLSRSTG